MPRHESDQGGRRAGTGIFSVDRSGVGGGADVKGGVGAGDGRAYLDVLERKPGALIGPKPLAAWRERGLWPESYDQLLTAFIDRHGKQSGTRQMIQVLSLIKPYGHKRVRAAVEEAIALSCADAAAVRHLVEAADLTHARDAIIELDALSRFERPLPGMTDYDGLLSEEVTP